MSAREPYNAVGLAEAIGAVREEVIRAQLESSEGSLTFRVGPVEMEFEVALTHRTGYSGELRVMVLTNENDTGREVTTASGTTSDATTHRVRLTLEPASTNVFSIE